MLTRDEMRLIEYLYENGDGETHEAVVAYVIKRHKEADAAVPEPPKADRPTADAMLDWLDRQTPGFRVARHTKGWDVDHQQAADFLAEDQPGIRTAIRKAMEVRP